jgi:hypothetical protein
MNKYLFNSLLAFCFLLASCDIQKESVELKHFPVDDLNGIVPQPAVQFDNSVSSDGNGSIRIEVFEPTTILLYTIDNIRIDNAQIFYEAKVKCENLNGEAYLEMWCVFKDKGEFFSRGFENAISGTTDWETITTPFMLKENEMPDSFKLNLVVNGSGTVWIDDIKLVKR